MSKGHLAALTFTLMFGFSYMFSKIALDYVSPIGLVAYRYLFAFSAIELLRITGVIKIKFTRKHLKTLILVVMFQPFLYSLFSTFGLNLIASSEAVMMVALVPVFSGLFSAIFLKERPSITQWLFTGLSIAGIIYIQGSLQGVESPSQPIGFILMIMAVMSGAAYNVTSRQASKQFKPLEVTYAMMLFGAASLNTLYLIELAITRNLSAYVLNLAQPSLLLSALYLGVFATVVAFFMLNYALSVLPAHRVAVYANLVTIIGIFAGYLLLNEPLFTFHFIGSFMVIVGVYGTVMSQSKKPIKAPL